MPERNELRSLEGHLVGMTLLDGSSLEDCQLISAPRHGAQTMWVLTSTGDDLFIPFTAVGKIWLAAPVAA